MNQNPARNWHSNYGEWIQRLHDWYYFRLYCIHPISIWKFSKVHYLDFELSRGIEMWNFARWNIHPSNDLTRLIKHCCLPRGTARKSVHVIQKYFIFARNGIQGQCFEDLDGQGVISPTNLEKLSVNIKTHSKSKCPKRNLAKMNRNFLTLNFLSGEKVGKTITW